MNVNKRGQPGYPDCPLLFSTIGVVSNYHLPLFKGKGCYHRCFSNQWIFQGSDHLALIPPKNEQNPEFMNEIFHKFRKKQEIACKIQRKIGQ